MIKWRFYLDGEKIKKFPPSEWNDHNDAIGRPVKATVAITIALFLGCHSAKKAKFGPDVVWTTYYPYTDTELGSVGPGHFNCAALNGEQHWYLAPSDTFGDPKIWSGPPCPDPGKGKIPDCSKVQQTCGVKVKLTCASNCRPNAPAVVAVITDACPKYHPTNIKDDACQKGPHFDISRDTWRVMHHDLNNIGVTYEVVDQKTPLGPVR